MAVSLLSLLRELTNMPFTLDAYSVVSSITYAEADGTVRAVMTNPDAPKDYYAVRLGIPVADSGLASPFITLGPYPTVSKAEDELVNLPPIPDYVPPTAYTPPVDYAPEETPPVDYAPQERGNDGE